jgi:hypothetical protein
MMQPKDNSNNSWLVVADWLDDNDLVGAEEIRNQIYTPVINTWNYEHCGVGVGSVGGGGGVGGGSVGGVGRGCGVGGVGVGGVGRGCGVGGVGVGGVGSVGGVW